MSDLGNTYKQLLRTPRFLWITGLSGLSLIISVMLNYWAGSFAFAHMSNGVSDLFLDRLPVTDVSFLFIDGAVAMAIGILIITLLHPRRLPAVLHNIALLYGIRSIALILTHLGPPLSTTRPILGDTITDRFVGGADYFFSGHTALPFIVALVFWDIAWIRYLFLTLTGIFGITALFGHLHYSIDVFVAPFMSYSTYAICTHFWPTSYSQASKISNS